MWIFGYFLNWIHLLRLTLEICCLTLEAQMDFVTEAMLGKVFWPGDGKSDYVVAENAHAPFLLTIRAEPSPQTGSYREGLEK